jgi:hypothetical protein
MVSSLAPTVKATTKPRRRAAPNIMGSVKVLHPRSI